MLPVWYNFVNLSRYADGRYCEKSIRRQFSRKLDFGSLFRSAFSSLHPKECVAAFDPGYIPKSGRKTYGKGRFWSSKDGRAKAGLEIGCLAMIDVQDRAAYSIEAVQTPAKGEESCMVHYVGIIDRHKDLLLSFTRYLAVDGYFMKKTFIDPVLSMGLNVITRMRPDANLRYLFQGKQKEGRGRKRLYAGKADVKHIDKRRWKYVDEDEHVRIYECIVRCVTLSRICKVVYLEHKEGSGYTLLLSTDKEMKAKKSSHITL